MFDLGIAGPLDEHGGPAFETAFSWRDLILLGGGLFLLWKATREIHHDDRPRRAMARPTRPAAPRPRPAFGFGAAITQIILLDHRLLDRFDPDRGRHDGDHLPVMVAAVIVAVGAMLLAADPLGAFIARNPSVVMLALGFLLMIGMVLIAEAFGAHVSRRVISTPRWRFLPGWSRRSTCGRSGAKAPRLARIERAPAPAYACRPMTVHFHEEDLPEGLLAPGPGRRRHRDDGADHAARPAVPRCRSPTGGGDEHLVRFAPGSDYAAPNLRAVLADPARLKLYHFARFDLAAIRFGISASIAAPVYCTKIGLAPHPHLYRPARAEGAGASELLGPGHLEAAAIVRLGRARAVRSLRSDYAASDVRYPPRDARKAGRAAGARRAAWRWRRPASISCPSRAELDLAGWPEIDIFAHA